ncbi:MAG: major capsid protein P2 [Zoogloeaceae bacterium]|jgi:hypothetical protein|nr:major capsid protein P2 [Zoogloeaceae bacterium]
MSVGTLIRNGLPFSNVVDNGVATNIVTPGRTIETLRLKLTAGKIADPENQGEYISGTFGKESIELVKIKANGKVIFEASGVQLDKLAKYRGQTTDAGFLDIDFIDESMLSRLDREVTSFDTSVGIANLTTEVYIKGASAPILKPILVESAQQKQSNGSYQPWAYMLAKLLRYPFSIATGGQLPVTVPFGAQHGAVIKRLHVFHTGKMTDAVVKQDGLVIFEASKDENEFFQKKAGRVPQENVFTIDFVADGSIQEALNTKDARMLEWLFTFSNADNGFVIVEYVDTLGNL